MDKEHYLRVQGNKSILVGPNDGGMYLSMHVPGGHLMFTLSKKEALDLFTMIEDIIDDLEN